LASLPEARGRPRIIELPLTEHTVSEAGGEPRSLGEVLRESAVDLAIRSLRAAAAVVDGRASKAQAKPACRVLLGPWSGPTEESPQPQA
jgi:hypothetical protein